MRERLPLALGDGREAPSRRIVAKRLVCGKVLPGAPGAQQCGEVVFLGRSRLPGTGERGLEL
jgi:hypothetical protein